MYFPSSENKGADQLRGHREADLRLCFRICRLLVFSRGGSIMYSLIRRLVWKGILSNGFLIRPIRHDTCKVKENIFVESHRLIFTEVNRHGERKFSTSSLKPAWKGKNETASGKKNMSVKCIPHWTLFVSAKLGFAGVYLFFLFLLQYSCSEAVLTYTHNPAMFWAKIFKISNFFYWKISIFTISKNLYTLHRWVALKCVGTFKEKKVDGWWMLPAAGIMKICPCNIPRCITAVKIKNFNG